MRAIASLVVLLGLMIATSTAFGRGSVPIIEHRDLPVKTSGGAAVSAEQVGAAIAAALDTAKAEMNFPWKREPAGPNAVLATLQVRGKHTIKVEISWSADKYSVLYKDSIDMNFETTKKKGPVIHPFYNKWVDELLTSINAEFAKL